jgi:hypothetical protein
MCRVDNPQRAQASSLLTALAWFMWSIVNTVLLRDASCGAAAGFAGTQLTSP